MEKFDTKLYGDGLHDDTAALQERIDKSKVFALPVPDEFYLISRPLVLHSDFVLKAEVNTEIKLAAKSDCVMLFGQNLENLTIDGGIWDMQNTLQQSNPLINGAFGEIKHDDMDDRYLGVAMRFVKINNFTFKNITLRDPVTFGMQAADVVNFTIDSITFDYRQGNPRLSTMDGIHIESGCHFGRITNLKGRTYDDLLAINADDFYTGPISDISVSGIFSNGGHSAIRMVSTHSPVERISVSDVFGTFYQYCIGLTKYYDMGDKSKIGYFDMISFKNIYASKHVRYPDFYPDDAYVFPLFYIESELHIKNLSINELHRREKTIDIPTVYVGRDSRVENFVIENCSYSNEAGSSPFLQNEGKIDSLSTRNIKLYGDNIKFY